MALQTRNTLKQYFQTGDYPTQQQFYDLIETMLLSGEVTINDIAGLTTALQAKADKSATDAFEGGAPQLFDADGYFDIPQGYVLEKVIVCYAQSGTLKIGTTAGGEEIMPATPYTVNDYNPITVDKYAKTATIRIYFTGLPSGTKIHFLKRFLKQ